MGIAFKFSMVYHPQIDGQTKVVNCSHGDLFRYLRFCLCEFDYVGYALMTKFVCNSLMNGLLV